MVLTGWLVIGLVAMEATLAMGESSFGLMQGTMIGAAYFGTSVLPAGGKRTTPLAGDLLSGGSATERGVGIGTAGTLVAEIESQQLTVLLEILGALFTYSTGFILHVRRS